MEPPRIRGTSGCSQASDRILDPGEDLVVEVIAADLDADPEIPVHVRAGGVGLSDLIQPEEDRGIERNRNGRFKLVDLDAGLYRTQRNRPVDAAGQGSESDLDGPSLSVVLTLLSQ